MELKSGFKQTDVGEIPEDWSIRTIGETLQLINGRAFKGEDWKEHGLPIIRIQNLNDTTSSFNYYIGRIEDKHRIEAGDLLFAWSGTTGTSFGARIWNGPPGVLNQHIFKVLPDEDKVIPRYAFLVLLKAQEDIEKRAHGFKASFVHVKKSDLVRIQLPLPSTKAEQEAIAAALNDADALIDSLEQLIAKKRQIKQGTMQALLTRKRRLPGFSGEWEVTKLGDLGVWKGGMTPSMRNPAFWDRGTIPWISSGDVKTVELARTGTLITEAAVTQGNTTMLPAECIVVVTRSGILRRYLPVAMNMVKMAINQDIKALIPERKHAPAFLLYLLIGYGERILSSCMKAGTTVESIELAWLKRFEVALPQKDEQIAIAAVLSDMDAELTALDAKLGKARHIKQGMMQELLTGRIRLR